MILVHGASQVVTPLHVIENGAVAAEDGRITFVGSSSEALSSFPNADKIDATGKLVIPGFVDAHTHSIFGGDRSNEFLMRLRGATYQEIAASGGGILSTMRSTRNASEQQLLETAAANLNLMLAHGTTTLEVKTGYGLSWESERKLLNVAHQLKRVAAQDIAITFLAAHDFPPEKSRDAYVSEIVREMLPKVAAEKSADFCDVFCDQGYYTNEQTSAISLRAAELGLKLKVHVDELADVNGAALAAELGAVSADHLIFANNDGIKKMAEAGVTAVLLPGTSIGLKSGRHAPARTMIENGVHVAIATDFNPGTCYCHSMQFILQLSPLLYRLTAEEALAAATLNAARAIGMEDRVGSLEPGKLMDCLIFDLPHYGHLFYNLGVNRLETVVKRGEIAWNKNPRLK